jgi:Sigma-70, region 4
LLRSWLYAVARNECHRRLRSGEATSALDDVADLSVAGGRASTAESADVASSVERAELRQLVRDAIDGLNPGERDVIELSLMQGLDSGELADALGVSRNHAHALQSRARSQLERSLGALVVARTGRGACPALEALLTGWDGQLTVLMRKRISRHIEQCEICGELKRRELSPALFAGALPLVALVPGFRAHVMKMCADHTPAGLAHRASVAARAGQFGPAQGGPVSYSISAAANLSISPASGSLASGASATITVTSSSLITLDEQLTINPGGHTVTVVLNISL